MKIIKEGIKTTNTVEESCFKCKTCFEYNSSDIQMDFRDGDYVICPTCEGFISAGYQQKQTDRRTEC